jgi:hypothetical protein
VTDPLDAGKERLLSMREDAIARALRERPPPQLIAIDAVLRALDEVPADAEPASRAVVSDDGQSIRLALHTDTGVIAAVELDPIRAISLAGELIDAALPKLA